MASPEAKLDGDLNVDAVLQQFMFDIEHCTADLSQAPPVLGDLSPFDGVHQPMPTSFGDAMYPNAAQASSLFDFPDALASAQAPEQPEAATSSKRSEAWTAKNRRAQKRFRERQKAQKGQMEQQLAEMAERMRQLKMDNNKIASRNSTLERVLQFREGEIAELQEQNRILEAEPDSGYAMQGTLVTSAQKPVSQMEAIIQRYRGSVNLMAGLLLRLDQEGPSESLTEEMKDAVQKSGQLSLQTAVLSPESIVTLMQINMDQRHTQLDSMMSDKGNNSPEHWQQVAEMLDLRPEQRRDMLNLHKRFLHNQEDNKKRRREICVGLQQGSDKVKKLHAAVATEAQKYVASMFEVHREVQELRDNLREQHRIWIDFYSTVFGVWDTDQYCRGIVHSFPRYPDILAVCTCMAQADAAEASQAVD